MKEKSIAKFKYENSTYKLLYITTEPHDYYLIVKDRRRIAQSIWEGTAKKKFMSIIAADILQQKITF